MTKSLGALSGGQLKTLISFDPAILLLEKLPHRYTHTSVQRKMERRTEKHPLEVKKKSGNNINVGQ